MGRSLSAQPVQTSLFLTAGATIANEDLLEIGSDGKAYPVTDASGAVVANKGTNVYAETQVAAGYLNEFGPRNAMLKDAQGNVYVIANTSAYNNIAVYKYSSSGTLLASVGAGALGTGTTYNTYCNYLRSLSNGNILVVWADNDTGQKLKFAILSTSLAVIKTATNVGTGPYGLTIGVTTLSGGGFALVYDNYTTNTQVRLATFDNAGNAVLAPTTIGTKTAVGAYCYVAELSNGNLAVSYSQNSGQFYGVFTTGGVQVLGFTSLSGYPGNAWMEISVIAGTFCIASVNAAQNGIAYTVCNNAGAVLGTQTVTASSIYGWPYHKLMNDGQNYYGVYSNSATSYLAVATIPTTGASITSVDFSSTGYNFAIDAYLSGSNIVWVAISNGGTAPYYGVHTLTGAQVTAATALGAGNTTGMRNIAVLDGGSSTLIGYWSWSSTSACKLIRKKVFNTAILGVADYAAAAGATVGLLYGSGAYRINALNLTAPLAFDHSATTIVGNKGTLLPISAVLKGF